MSLAVDSTTKQEEPKALLVEIADLHSNSKSNANLINQICKNGCI